MGNFGEMQRTGIKNMEYMKNEKPPSAVVPAGTAKSGLFS